MNRNFRD